MEHSVDQVDLVVIGAGPGGYVAALRAAQLGLKTVCVEKSPSLGGTCLNIGCIPSKALLDSSEHFSMARHQLGRHGVLVSDVRLDLTAMMKRKDQVVKGLTTGVASLFRKAKIEHVQGSGRIVKTPQGIVVEVKGLTANPRQIRSANVLIATGSVPSPLPSAPFDGKRVISSTEALALAEVPNRMVVIGAGAIGLELGSVWARLGSKVTVVEFMDHVVPICDRQASAELLKALTRQGLEFKLSTKVTRTIVEPNGVRLETQNASGRGETLEADVCLVAVGRRAFTEGLGLSDAGVATDDRGRVVVNEDFATNIPGVYAIGDVVRGPMLAHKAEEEGIAAVEKIAGRAGHVNYAAIPNVVYTWPEVAWVGLTEEQCTEQQLAYRAGSFPFLANGRAKAMDEAEGFVKVIADAKNDRVLGVHIVGPRASDMIAEAVAVMEFGGSSEDIARTCHAHPTLSEALKEAALAVDKRQLHL